ncbi:Endo-1,4-beta-xylanase A [bioreactor metagenome]|uniref:Endo-1,4-beta-xylanase A n=1 Tax=bioreactor metagenome TaxID=1076179 RepID=A0A644XHQ4_9ZZZZ
MQKRFFALLLSLLLTAGSAAAFSDVSDSDWFAQEVEVVTGVGLMSGSEDGYFLPQLPVSRGMVVTVLYRMEGMPAVNAAAAFSDVAEGEWYADSALWAQTVGIAAGYDDGRFGPDDPVTREQLAVFLFRYASFRGMEIAQGVLGGFRDEGSVSSWALEGMKHAVGAGLLTGGGGAALDPRGTATRAQLAVILFRILTPVSG